MKEVKNIMSQVDVDKLLAEQEGWDYQPSGGNNLFVQLNKKDDTARVRIIGEVVHADKYWDGQRYQNWSEDSGIPKEESKKRFMFCVLARNEDGSTSVKLLETGVSLYSKIKAIKKDEEWGDPETYDIRITRTEESPADFYSVAPLPSNAGPITDEEKEMLEKSEWTENRRRLELLLGIKKEPQASSGDEELDLENAPDNDQIDVDEAVGAEDTDNGEDDLPF